jgi:hypothetical protein
VDETGIKPDLRKAIAIGQGCGPKDLDWLARAARGCECILELGSFRGRSARAMLDNSNAMLWCVDTWRGSGRGGKSAGLRVDESDYQLFRANLGDVWHRVIVMQMTTNAAAGWFEEHGRRGFFDLIFIDADHSYPACRADIVNYTPFLREGGILSGHDYQAGWKGVDRAVAELVLNPQHGGKAIWWAEEPWLKAKAER